MRLLHVFTIAAIMLGLMAVANVDNTKAHTNQCSTWATMVGKEGRVRDSLHMHLLGCDDGPYTTKHYHASDWGEGCTAQARTIVRSNPAYYVYRPWTVARLVIEARPWCIVYEDGSYEDNSTH